MNNANDNALINGYSRVWKMAKIMGFHRKNYNRLVMGAPHFTNQENFLWMVRYEYECHAQEVSENKRIIKIVK